MSGFDAFIPGARDFLARLRAENTRDWFKAHQDEYEAVIRAPALSLLAEVAPRLSAMTGGDVSEKLFRPQRDIRFSKDKTPYKDHCHMLWHAPAGSAMGYYFGVSPDYVRIGAGVMGFKGKALDKWRAFAAGEDGAALAAALEAAGTEVSEPELKRVPAPYPADHPQGALIRRKSLTTWVDGDPAMRDVPGTLADQFERFLPVTRVLAGAL